MLDTAQYLLGALSGVIVGLSLGLVGGGGSILAVPLIIYLVGVSSPHVAIGTSALAVAVNALIGLGQHARHKNVAWRTGLMFAAAGVLGALLGSTAGKAIAGHHLLFLFALLMVVVGVLMLRLRDDPGVSADSSAPHDSPKVLGYGGATGLMSGFFGIGGGFLIVPALMAAARMPMYRAVGTSLVAVSAFGIATFTNYAFSGLVDWFLALSFIFGGFFGSFAGMRMAERLADSGKLRPVFVTLIFAVAAYMIWHSLSVEGILPG